MILTILKKAPHFFWAALLLTLPITSFPFFPGFFGSDAQVRPLSLYPLTALVFLVTLPKLLTKRLPRTLIPLILFVVLSVAISVFSLSRGITPNISVSVSSRVLRTLVTLGIGTLFYFTVSLYPQDKEDLRFTLRCLFIGFTIAMLWASFQAIYVIRFNQRYFSLLNEIQGLISTRRLFDKRISGMSFEPSWFAEQLTFLLMPFLFSSVISNYSVFKWRKSWLTVEVILLSWSFLVLLFTFSRFGLALFFILLLTSLMMGFRRVKVVKPRISFNLLKQFLIISLVLILILLIVFIVAQKNNYFARLWSYWTDEESEGTYLYYIAFSQRFAYWETAIRIFNEYPVLGIGLGNFTHYFRDFLPYRQYRNPELIMKLVPEKGRNQVVTVKNFGLRILAETGIVGTAVFVSFIIALGGCVVYLMLTRDPVWIFFGRAGLLGLLSFFFVTLSIDSFAIPNTWVVFGIITSSAFISRSYIQSQGDLGMDR
jgi:O-antigen ligase